MTNICQAIEHELLCIKRAESLGQDMSLGLGFGSGMSVAMWRYILLNPETMRIEVSRDFSEACVQLLQNAVHEGTIAPTYDIKHPIVMFLPDFAEKGVFVLNHNHRENTNDPKKHQAWIKDVTPISRIPEFGVSIPLSENDTYIPEIMNKFDNVADATQMRKGISDMNIILAAVLYVMSQPNFVTQTTVGSNGVRKRLEKKNGIPKERWSRIQWNVGKHVQREVRETMGEEHCTALHRVRGFYRTAKSHYNNVKKIDGKWFQWIEPFWRGHPAFGIVKSSYAPNFTEEDKNE
jgi:hypothetical protein